MPKNCQYLGFFIQIWGISFIQRIFRQIQSIIRSHSGKLRWKIQDYKQTFRSGISGNDFHSLNSQKLFFSGILVVKSLAWKHLCHQVLLRFGTLTGWELFIWISNWAKSWWKTGQKYRNTFNLIYSADSEIIWSKVQPILPENKVPSLTRWLTWLSWIWLY